MNQWTLFTPAETLFILEPKTSTSVELARVTFLDLVMRKVLSAGPAENSLLVERGPNFNRYQLLAHERIFLPLFEEDKSLKISLNNLIKSSFQRITSSANYKLKYIYSDRLKDYFTANFFQRLIGTKSINEEGLKLKTHILSHLSKMSNRVNSEHEILDVSEQILALRGNVLLLKNIDFSMLRHLDKSSNKKQTDQRNDHEPWYDYSVFYMTHQTPYADYSVADLSSSTFENSADYIDSSSSSGDSSAWNSGCSGDSGCSGCSGCGGCGS